MKLKNETKLIQKIVKKGLDLSFFLSLWVLVISGNARAQSEVHAQNFESAPLVLSPLVEQRLRKIYEEVRKLISESYPHSEIEFLSSLQELAPPELLQDLEAEQPTLVSLGASPEAYWQIELRFKNQKKNLRLSLGFSAHREVYIATRRVFPNQRIEAKFFQRQLVNLTTPHLRDLRGVILDTSEDLNRLEARQTILEGQALLSTSVTLLPDLRRGDSVGVRLISGELNLSTQGTANENAQIGSSVRVIAGKNKKEFVGKLVSPGWVEVRL